LGSWTAATAGGQTGYVDLALLVGELEERYGAEAQTALVGAYGDLRWDGPKAEFYRDLYELF
jgi:hypothetical protein